MKPFQAEGQSWPDDEPTHKADVVFEFVDWCKQQGHIFNDLRSLAEEFKEQYRD